MRYPFIEAHREHFSVSAMCRVMGVSSSGYYSWRSRKPSLRSQQDMRLSDEIERIFRKSDQTYGSHRIQRALRSNGIRCGRNRVLRLMRDRRLKPRQKRRFKVTTDSNHNLPVAKNLLNRHFKVARPNACWNADITYIWTSQGWLYLAVVMDLYSRRIIGWSMQPTMERDLVLSALKMALALRRPGPDLLHHSDQGSQYASNDYQKLLIKKGFICSMSRKGDCWDNAPVESFFATLKKERVHHRRYRTREQARTDIFRYIEGWYNRKRLHSALGYMSPCDYEIQQKNTNHVSFIRST